MNLDIHHLLQTVDKLFEQKRQREKPQNSNDIQAEKLSFQDKVALWITGALGTMWAVYFFAVFMGVWMLWQSTLAHSAFDPYPFAFLLFLGNIVQLLLMPLIMVGQNIQASHAEVRADEQYKATMGSYQDAEHIMDHLSALDKELLLHRQLLCQLILTAGGALPDSMPASQEPKELP
ncbi:MAG TPA: DUF1003 domain-containing protein [Candidatus Obscuribacterales bacterium]